ncbi:bifunctional metallophosphatase/5'-nucleotidase [Candidatus Sumerlaeota bacterium]|nr:bifunctional metallophosphatase/5'-nucleotidase [Candidatus Sumerlaeota bacterium]
MLRGFSYWIALLALLCTMPAKATTDTLVILHTNDVHAHLLPDDQGRGGWDNIAAYVHRLRGERPDVLVLDAGDMTQGTPVSSIYNGAPIFHVMNAIGYDCAVLGNHEFDNGVNYIQTFKDIANFPILSATAVYEGQLIADAPTALLDMDGVRVGIIGLTTSHAVDQPGLIIRDPAETLLEYAEQLRPQCDLLIALTHLGVQEDRRLAAAVEGCGLNVIVGGHSHTALDEPVRVGDTWIVQSGQHGRNLGRVDIVLDKESQKIVSIDAKLIPVPVEGMAPLASVKAVIDEWEGKVSGEMDVVIGQNPQLQTKAEFKQNVERVWQQKYGVDFAFHNPGGTRENLPAGDITIRKIWQILPFDNTLYRMELTQEQVKVLLPDAAFEETKPLYTLITNSYVGDRFIEEHNIPAERWKELPENFRDPVLEYIQREGRFNPQSIEAVPMP